jgi:hypothetical protein
MGQFIFPADSCCNCGSTSSIRVIDQDTRLTQYLLVGGAETTFTFPLPFCSTCAVTATRRRATPLHRLLIFGLMYFCTFGVLLLAGVALDSERLLEQTGWLSAVLALAGCTAWYSSRRPSPGQSSYYQPVWIGRYKQPFLSVPGRGMALGFSNPAYARSFEAANAPAVNTGRLQVQHP